MLSLKRCRLHWGCVSHDDDAGKVEHNVPHDLLLKSTFCDQSIYIDYFFLPDTVCTIHCLEILHRVPVVLNEDDGVCASEGQT